MSEQSNHTDIIPSELHETEGVVSELGDSTPHTVIQTPELIDPKKLQSKSWWNGFIWGIVIAFLLIFGLPRLSSSNIETTSTPDRAHSIYSN